MKRLLTIIILSGIFATPLRAAKPRLVVNIVVSQMRYDYLSRLVHNMPEGGFRKFLDQGVVFTDARYNFMQTTTPATLATLTTGADPSMHGIVSTRWIDYTTNEQVFLLEDHSAAGHRCDHGVGCYSPVNITTPTLGDRLVEEVYGSKVVTVAVDPMSAVVMGGQHSAVYWMDDSRGNWISSSAYMDRLPEWVESYNATRIASQYLDYKWMAYIARYQYVNKVFSVMDFAREVGTRRMPDMEYARREGITLDYPRVLYTPGGNALVTEFAKQAIKGEQMGADAIIDMINVCYDSPRIAGEYFGTESIEIEDMFYRLDAEIAGLISYVEGVTGRDNVVFVLTADHGASDSFDSGLRERERFNSSQFKVIVNGFMNAQYGPGDWVVDYCDRQLYLNRNQIYMNNLSLEEVQNRVSAFVLQFRGVGHVLTSTAMQNSSFNGGYAEKMQNSYYPRRSGDLMINLMPGWIEEAAGKRASSGSMYEYDTHVPLMFLGSSFPAMRIDRPLNMRDVAPTLSRIMGISRPIASEGMQIEEIVRYY